MMVMLSNGVARLCPRFNDTVSSVLYQVSGMEDELEDRIFYQTYISHMKLISKFAVGLPLNSSHFGYVWRILRSYVLKPEVLFLTSLLVLVVVYIQYVEVWSRSLLSKLHFTLGTTVPSKVQKLQYFVKPSGDLDKSSWELKRDFVAAYAIQGRRPRMEDRFVVSENIENTGVSFYAVFDGHGGESAADYAKDKMMVNLSKKIVDLKKIITGSSSSNASNESGEGRRPSMPVTPPSPAAKRGAGEGGIAVSVAGGSTKGRKSSAMAEDMAGRGVTDPLLLEKMGALRGSVTRDPTAHGGGPPPYQPPDIHTFVENSSSIDYGKLLTSELLYADRLIVEQAKKVMDLAGSTALIAVLEGKKLFVANVGDSRGVMCDSKGTTIPLSFDHKPQQVRELARIKEAGGFISFNGVWRVSGILATSRALGDYPLKLAGLVIAEPDILTFDLSDHKPRFILLASDGLWDTFSNEEAVAFVRSQIDSGAKPADAAHALVNQAFQRGSLDNITVLVVSLAHLFN